MSGLVYGFDAAPIFKHLGGLERLNASHFASVRREIGEYMLGNVQDNFDGQRLFDGSAMPPSKAAAKRAGKTLIDKHHLYDSYVYQLTGSGVEIGSAKVYAAIHQFGGQTGRGHKTNITARPVLGVSASQEKALGDFMIAEIGRLQ
jgi:phage virion morphogenesis protein